MKKIILLCVMIVLVKTAAFSQNAVSQEQSFGQDFIQGLEAYKLGAWEDALFFLKRTSNFQNASSDAVWYFVIMAELQLGDYAAVLRDGKTFLEVFPESSYVAEISYQSIYASYELGLYNEAIVGFTNFNNMYPEHAYTSHAIFFTGEALYNVYEFERAKTYFDKIIVEYPTSAKYSDALFRVELLKQREREEKLLYLLRVTGEEAVAAKEDYERQIKQLQSEESLLLSKRVHELEHEVSRLQIEKQDLSSQNDNLKNTVQELNNIITENASKQTVIVEATSTSEKDTSLIDSLTQKSLELQKILNEE